MGADVRGAGTDKIRIEGVRELHGTVYSTIPDQIEAGTFMCEMCIRDRVYSHQIKMMMDYIY